MPDAASHLNFLRELTWQHALMVGAVLLAWSVVSKSLRFFLHRTAADVAPERRLVLMRWTPVVRLLIGIVGVAAIIDRKSVV